MYVFLNLNLLDYSWISLSLRTTSECALLCKTFDLETPQMTDSCQGLLRKPPASLSLEETLQES